MTKQELNRDIKKLSSEIYRMSFNTQREYQDYIANEARKEFLRLYLADRECTYMTKDSIIRMITMNRSHCFIPAHQLFIKASLV